MFNAITIIASKMSHCTGTVQMREESESGIRKWEEMWFKTTAEAGERGGSSDVRWKTVPQTSGCNRKRSVADSGQRVGYVERPETLMRQNVVVVWLQCLLVDVVRHIGTGTLAPDHADIGTPKQRPHGWFAQRPSASEVGKAAGWCGQTSTARISAYSGCIHHRLKSLQECMLPSAEFRSGNSNLQTSCDKTRSLLSVVSFSITFTWYGLCVPF